MKEMTRGKKEKDHENSREIITMRDTKVENQGQDPGHGAIVG